MNLFEVLPPDPDHVLCRLAVNVDEEERPELQEIKSERGGVGVTIGHVIFWAGRCSDAASILE